MKEIPRIGSSRDANQSQLLGNGTHGSNFMFFEQSKLIPWMMLTAILAAFALAFSLLTFFYLHDQQLSTQRSFELMRIQVLSQNAIMLRQGFIKPGDEWDGPEGNLQFNPNLLKRK